MKVQGWTDHWGGDDWEHYGSVRVEIADGRTADVGVVVGVPRHFRDTATAAGGDTHRDAYLEAWYAESSDWSNAEISDGSEFPSELMEDVLDALASEAPRLWRDAQDRR